MRAADRLPVTQDMMDKNEHLPGDSLADFTEEELFSLIDAGTTGAFSELYRRHIASAAALTAADTPNPRSRADAAFLAILKSLLDGTADRTSGFAALIRDEIGRRADRGSVASSPEFAEAEPEDLSPFALIASSFSSLPDNWQRILWLREVEGQSAQSAAELLGITSATAERLTARAHEELESTWAQTRPADGPRSIADRAELVPALLTSPILIERLSDTFVAAPHPDLDTEAAAAGSVDTDELPAATEPPDAACSGESSADTIVPSAVTPASEAPKATGEPSTETIDEPSAAAAQPTTAAPSASEHSANHPVAESDGPTDHDENAKFTLPKPVLIPLIAACLGLLCTLLGFAILPHGASTPGPRTNSTTQSDTGSTSEQNSTTDEGDESTTPASSESSAPDAPEHGDDTPSRRGEDRDADTGKTSRAGDRSAESPENSPGSTTSDTPPNPSDSDDPTAPDEPSSPEEPGTPSEPDPTDDTPSQPEPTEDPGAPSEPDPTDDSPSDPEPSDDPGAPSEPETPSAP